MTGVRAQDIHNATINFTVPVAWIEAEQVTAVHLYTATGKDIPVSSQRIQDNVHYSADVTALETFIIAGSTDGPRMVPETAPPDDAPITESPSSIEAPLGVPADEADKSADRSTDTQEQAQRSRGSALWYLLAGIAIFTALGYYTIHHHRHLRPAKHGPKDNMSSEAATASQAPPSKPDANATPTAQTVSQRVDTPADRQRTETVEHDLQANDTERRMKEFVTKARAKGLSTTQIRAMLLANGWSEAALNHYIPPDNDIRPDNEVNTRRTPATRSEP
jgi:hypothetical protein